MSLFVAVLFFLLLSWVVTFMICKLTADRSAGNPINTMLSQYLSNATDLDPQTAHMLFTTQRFSQMWDKLHTALFCRWMNLLFQEEDEADVGRWYNFGGWSILSFRHSIHCGKGVACLVFGVVIQYFGRILPDSHRSTIFRLFSKDDSLWLFQGVSVDWCREKESGLLKPDLVLYMDLLPAEVQKRGGFGQERYETFLFQEKVYEAYRRIRDDSWKVRNPRLEKWARSILPSSFGFHLEFMLCLRPK